MTLGARAERAEERVRRWVESTMDMGPEAVGVYPAPHLSTPRFDLVLLDQVGTRSGGELYVMTDGERVLPLGAASLGTVLAEEGLAEDPSALPAELVAELFFRMAEVGRGRPILDAGDSALGGLPADARSAFAPPHAERDGDGARLRFWSERSGGAGVERWSVRLGADGALESHAEAHLLGGSAP